MRPALSPATPSQPPAHTCSTRSTIETATTVVSLDGPPAPVTCVLVRFPIVSPWPLPMFRCVPSADSDGNVPIPRFSHRPALVSCYGDAKLSFLRPSVSHLSSSCLFSPCCAGRQTWPMRSRVWLRQICFFFCCCHFNWLDTTPLLLKRATERTIMRSHESILLVCVPIHILARIAVHYIYHAQKRSFALYHLAANPNFHR
jgi:hypothetical protein